MMSYNYHEGTISYTSVLIENKKPSMTLVPMEESRYYLASFWIQKGKVRVLSRRGLLFADSEKEQLYFQKAFLIKLN